MYSHKLEEEDDSPKSSTSVFGIGQMIMQEVE